MKTFNIRLNEPINPIITSIANNEQSVNRETSFEFTVTVSVPDYVVTDLTAVIDENASIADLIDVDGFIAPTLKDGSPTGTLSIAQYSKTLAVDGGALTTEAAKNDLIYIPLSDKWFSIVSIESNTSATLDVEANSNISADWQIYNPAKFMVTGGVTDTSDSPTKVYACRVTKVEASNDDQQTPSTWAEIDFSEEAAQIEKLDGVVPKHIRHTISVQLTGLTQPKLEALTKYGWVLSGSLQEKEYTFVDELTV